MRLRARPVVALRRKRKAQMIEAFLTDALALPPRKLRILDIGSGNGEIAAYFSEHNYCVGVDVSDQFHASVSHIPHCLGRSESLPFRSGCFDIVISHHVIEHVDDHDLHLKEIRRVMKSCGVAYLGTPNLSSPLMRGHAGNPMVLRYREMLPLFKKHGFSVDEYYTRWLHEPAKYYCETQFGRFVPASILHSLRRWYPSQCFLLKPAD